MKNKRSKIFIILIVIVTTLFILAMIPYKDVELKSAPKGKREVWEIKEEITISNETIFNGNYEIQK